MTGVLTPSRASEILSRHGLRAGRRHGQHFLVDPNTVRKIVRLAEISPGETVLEIGPGIGSLTVALSEAARRVVAIEIDEDVAVALREVIDGLDNVELVLADALHTDIGDAIGGPARLIANLPYNVATPLFVRILEDVPTVSGGLVMVQKELGDRWTSSPGSKAYGAVTLKTAYYSNARVVADVPRTVFMPPPKVASVLVEFTRRDEPPVDVGDPAPFFSFVQQAFAHRRKTLRNSLFDYDVVGALQQLSLDDRSRPEELDLTTFAALYKAVS